MRKEKKEKWNKFYILLFFLFLPFLLNESLYLIQDFFVKPPLYKLKEEQFTKINREFDKIKENKAKTPKPMRLNDVGLKRGEKTRNLLNVKFSERRRPNWRDQYKPSQMLGFGQYGTTFTTCVNSECVYVIKSSRPFDLKKGEMKRSTSISKQLIVNEVFALLDIAQAPDKIKKYVPRIYDFFSDVDNNGEETYYMVQEKFEKCFTPPNLFEKFAARNGFGRWKVELNKMEMEIKKMISKLNNYGWMHLDFHEDNILCRFGDEVEYILIDWGLSFCVDDLIDSSHPISMHYEEGVKFHEIKNLQKIALDDWYKIVIEHTSFGSLEQKRKTNF